MSIDQEWTEAMKACLGSIPDPDSKPSSSHAKGQDGQPDNVPSSSLSPECSPQRSPDSQHKDTPPKSKQGSFSLSQQDKCVSQSGVVQSALESKAHTKESQNSHRVLQHQQMGHNNVSGPEQFRRSPQTVTNTGRPLNRFPASQSSQQRPPRMNSPPNSSAHQVRFASPSQAEGLQKPRFQRPNLARHRMPSPQQAHPRQIRPPQQQQPRLLQNQVQQRPRLPNNPGNAPRMAFNPKRSLNPARAIRPLHPGAGPSQQMQSGEQNIRSMSNLSQGSSARDSTVMRGMRHPAPPRDPRPQHMNMSAGESHPMMRDEDFDEEDFYDEDEDFDEEMDEEDYYEQYHHGLVRQQAYDSSDSEEYSDTEDTEALLEELSDCPDEDRRQFLICQLQEMGVAEDEINLALLERQELYNREQENAISSSSQPFHQRPQQKHPMNSPAIGQQRAQNINAGTSQGNTQQLPGPHSNQPSHSVSQSLQMVTQSSDSTGKVPHTHQSVTQQSVQSPRPSSSITNQIRKPIRGMAPQTNLATNSPQGQIRPLGPRIQGPRPQGPQSSNQNQNIPGEHPLVQSRLSQPPGIHNIHETIRQPNQVRANRPSINAARPSTSMVGQSRPPSQGGFVRPQAPPRQMRPRLPTSQAFRVPSQHMVRGAQNISQPRPIRHQALPGSTGDSSQVGSPESAPSEPKLARLAVQYMQQSLDKEIMAKKGGPVNVRGMQQTQVPTSRGTAQAMYRFPPAGQGSNFQQLRHTLPPRVQYPEGINNINTQGNDSGQSGGKPVCSVVPFTNQNIQTQQTPNQTLTTSGAVRPNLTQHQTSPSVRFRQPSHPFLQPHSQQHASLQQQSPNQFSPALSGSPARGSYGSSPIVSTQQPIQNSNSQSHDGISQQGVSTPASSQSTPKTDSFSLDRLSADKCVDTTGTSKGLTPNMVYQIRSPIDNSLVLAVWTGQKFQDLPESGAQTSQTVSTPTAKVVSKSPACTQSNPNTSQGQPVRLPVATPVQDSPSTSSQDSSVHRSEAADTNSQNRPLAPILNSQATFVKPLPQGQKAASAEEDEDPDDDSMFKKPFSENEDHFRVCKFCGYTSRNFKRCEGCKRIFQGELKVFSLKKNQDKAAPNAATGTTSPSVPEGQPKISGMDLNGAPHENIMKNISFYGKSPSPRGKGTRGGTGRTRGGGVKGKGRAKASDSGSCTSESEEGAEGDKPNDCNSSDGSIEGQGKKRGKAKSKNSTPRKRSKKNAEPVTLTISSDEDEPSSTSNSMPGFPPSPANSSGSESGGSGIFPRMKPMPVTGYGRFRRARMEDEEGKSKLAQKISTLPVTSNTPFNEEENDEDREEEDDEDEAATYEIEIRSVRVGSMRTIADGPLFINVRGVCMRVKSESTEELFECEILTEDVEKVKFCCEEAQRVLFLFLTTEGGEKLRANFLMEPGDEEYFDPASTDMRQKMVVVIIEDREHIPIDMIRENLSLWADLNDVEDINYIEELTAESANDLLIQSAPPVLSHGAGPERDLIKFKKRYRENQEEQRPPSPTNNEPDSTSSSPSEQPIVRLLQYPFPPSRGIPITTEDLWCLRDGEFLNDVIIDFYLQYIYEECLSEENKKRTHIFSSFFYKRLTQKDKSEKTEEGDAKKSLPLRRHARVKKWTKSVDLFSKDFIIVPINEHSHWYLAVICFSGLANPEVVPFIPSTIQRETGEEDSNGAGESEETSAEEKSSEPPTPKKTILGKQLDPQKCLDNEESKYNLGQKTPCILMFDSLMGPSRASNIKLLKDYLQCEWDAKKEEPRNLVKILKGSTPKVPQQSNYSDCGIYLLQYVESFFMDPIADFHFPMKGLSNWFTEEPIRPKRQEIHELIMELHQRFQEMRGDPKVYYFEYDSAPREDPESMPFDHPDMDEMMEEMMPDSEDMMPGEHRDDDSSNSSFPGDMNRTELANMHFEEDSQEEDEEEDEGMHPENMIEIEQMEGYEEESPEKQDKNS